MDACLQILFQVLLHGGVSLASLDQLKREPNRCIVLQQCQEYVNCIPSKEQHWGLVVQAWQALVQRDAMERRNVVQELWKCQRRSEPNHGKCRQLVKESQRLAETCAASQLGLYRVQVYQTRLMARTVASGPKQQNSSGTVAPCS